MLSAMSSEAGRQVGRATTKGTKVTKAGVGCFERWVLGVDAIDCVVDCGGCVGLWPMVGAGPGLAPKRLESG